MAVSKFKPHSHLYFGQTGTGYYSDSNMGIYDVIKEATPLALSAADRIKLGGNDRNVPIVICDYGTADGGISMYLMRELIDCFKRKYGSDQCINIIYEDQSCNDFNSLFTRIHDPGSYLHDYDMVYVTACGTNFYSQCFPPETVHFGFSSNAMHWLYKSPGLLTDCLNSTMSKIPDERSKFTEQAEQDWETILLLRAAELKKGGQMVIVNLSIDEDGQSSGHTKKVKEFSMQQLTNILTAMVQEGKITEDEFTKTSFNAYERTEAEHTKPLTDKQSKVYKAGLRLVSIETKVIPCPYHTSWMQSGKTKDDKDAARAHAKLYVLATRSWSSSTFKSALSDHRLDTEMDELMDELFKRFEDNVAKNPQEFATDYVNAYIHIEKV